MPAAATSWPTRAQLTALDGDRELAWYLTNTDNCIDGAWGGLPTPALWFECQRQAFGITFEQLHHLNIKDFYK